MQDSAVNIHHDPANVLYQKLKGMFYQQSEKVQPFGTRSLTRLTSGESTITFTLCANNNKRVHEADILVDNGDGYAFHSIALCLMKVIVTKKDKELIAGTRLFSYVNTAAFNYNLGKIDSEANSLRGVYNGELGLKVGSEEIIYKIPTEQFLHVPMIQFNGKGFEDSCNFLDRFKPVYKHNLVLGSKNVDFTLKMFHGERNMEGGTVTIDGTDYEQRNYAVLLTNGFVVRGAAEALTHAQMSNSMREAISKVGSIAL